MASIPLVKSISVFLVLCGIWEGNAGNRDVWFGEEGAGGADKLLLQPGPLVPVLPKTVIEAKPPCAGKWPPLRWKPSSSERAEEAQLGNEQAQMDIVSGLSNGAIPGPEPNLQAQKCDVLCCNNSWFALTSADGLSPPQAFLSRFQGPVAQPREMCFLPRGTRPSLILATYSRKTLPSEGHGINSPTPNSRYPEC